MFNPTLKIRETILFFLIMIINGLICIVSDMARYIQNKFPYLLESKWPFYYEKWRTIHPLNGLAVSLFHSSKTPYLIH